VRAVIDLPAVPSERRLAEYARGLLEVVIDYNRDVLRQARGRIPKFYNSGVRFRAEPWQGALEQFCGLPVLLRRGWGDCAQLCCWRVAELREQGVPATLRFYWRLVHTAGGDLIRAYHVQVRHPPSRAYPRGYIEDPSRLLEY
jgi:hypothetical protein